jgi:hypothetical protein
MAGDDYRTWTRDEQIHHFSGRFFAFHWWNPETQSFDLVEPEVEDDYEIPEGDLDWADMIREATLSPEESANLTERFKSAA